MEFSHYAPLWGEALLTILAVLVVLLGSLMKNSGKLMGYLSAAGLVASIWLRHSHHRLRHAIRFVLILIVWLSDSQFPLNQRRS